MTEDQFATLVGLLTEIRDALAFLCSAEPEPEPEPPGCQHPEERRINFSTPGVTHWSCQDCGYIEYRGPVTHAPARPSGADAKE